MLGHRVCSHHVAMAFPHPRVRHMGSKEHSFIKAGICMIHLDLEHTQFNGPISRFREYRQHKPKVMDSTLPPLSYSWILAMILGTSQRQVDLIQELSPGSCKIKGSNTIAARQQHTAPGGTGSSVVLRVWGFLCGR